MAQITSTNEIAEYLKLHPITVIKYTREGRIPGSQLGKVWRFDKEVIDRWIAMAQNGSDIDKDIRRKAIKNSSR